MQDHLLFIRAGQLIDGNGGPPLRDAVIAITGERVAQVGSPQQIPIPPEAEVIDASSCTVLPGLIDAHVHVHLTGDSIAHGLSELQGMQALKAYSYVRQDLEMGFTTLRSLGSPNFVDVALRDAINQGIVEGPRLVVAGMPIGATAGHMDGRWAPDVTVHGQSRIANGPWECRQAAREQIKRGVDVIKISASIGTSHKLEQPWFQDMAFDEIAAVVEQAHWFNRRVAAHTAGGPGSTAAILAGVDSLEHSHWLDDEQLALMLERGTFYVPTLIVNERCAPAARDPVSGVPSEKAAWLLKAQREKWDTLARAKRMGVKIVAGTDAGCLVYHGENACELEELVKGGFTPMEAIVAATRTAADCLDMSKDVGTIEAGKYADLVVVDGDPLADISILKDRARIAQVLKGGKRIWKTA